MIRALANQLGCPLGLPEELQRSQAAYLVQELAG